MSLESTVVSWLPTLTAKLALVATLVLGFAPFALPEYIVSEVQLSGQAQLWFLKLAVSLALLLLGACVTLLIVIHHYTRGNGQHEIADRILKIRAQKNREALAHEAFITRVRK